VLAPRQRVLALLLAIAAVAWVAGTHAPDEVSFYPPCLVHKVSGWHCPGCGSARALHAVASARFTAAFSYNALAIIFLGALAPWAAWQAWLGLRHNRFATLSLPPPASQAIVWTIACFTIARNLPWPPFSWLAPAS
jgi:hypothetical protein